MKFAFVIPYFGRLPRYFPLWLKSCAVNPDFDFLLFTDDLRSFAYPDNVLVHPMQFSSLQELVQSKFSFPVALPSPYKLCDYKAAYGEIFSAFLQGYDYWGFCDVDVIWGNMRKFISDQVLQSYDRIYTRGHCSLFKNNETVNRYYKTLKAEGCLNYKEVYTTEESCYFDEWGGRAPGQGGLSALMARNKIPMYDGPDMADLDCSKSSFVINHRKERHAGRFEFTKNGLFVIDRKGKKEEIVYVHFQKRLMVIPEELGDVFYLVPPGFVQNTPDGYRLRRLGYRAAQKAKHYRFKANRLIKKLRKAIGK